MAQLSRRCEASAGDHDEGAARRLRCLDPLYRRLRRCPSRPNPERPVARNASEPGSGVDGAPDPDRGRYRRDFATKKLSAEVPVPISFVVS